MCNIIEEKDVNAKVMILVATEVVVVETTMKKEDKWISKTGVDEATVVEEVVVQIVQMLNVTISENMDTTQRIAMSKKVEESENLVKEDETKDEGILMMTNEDITLDNDMVWYLDTGASSNHMYRHKHLFVNIQEIEDGHASFGDSMKVPVKGRENIFDSQKDEKEGTM